MFVHKKFHGCLIGLLQVTGKHNCDRPGVINQNFAMFRCNEAKVLFIAHMDTGREYDTAYSLYNPTFKYTVEETVKIDCDIDDQDGEGIHFFKSYQGAYEFNKIISDKQRELIKHRGFNGEIVLIQYYDNGELMKEASLDNGKIKSIFTNCHRYYYWEQCEQKEPYISSILFLDINDNTVLINFDIENNTVEYWSKPKCEYCSPENIYTDSFIAILEKLNNSESNLFSLELQRLKEKYDGTITREISLHESNIKNLKIKYHI